MGRKTATNCRVCGTTERLEEGWCPSCRSAKMRERRLAKQQALGIEPRTRSEVCKICGEPRAPNRSNLYCVEHLRGRYAKKTRKADPNKPPKFKPVKVKVKKVKAVAPPAALVPPLVVSVVKVDRVTITRCAPDIDSQFAERGLGRIAAVAQSMREAGL